MNRDLVVALRDTLLPPFRGGDPVAVHRLVSLCHRY
jgi:hypothetical protein